MRAGRTWRWAQESSPPPTLPTPIWCTKTCVMGAAFASDFKLVTRDAIGWRGQVSEALVAQLLFCSRDSTSSCLLLSRELMLSCPIAGE